jgi:xanthine dehydrogenase accessory factor
VPVPRVAVIGDSPVARALVGFGAPLGYVVEPFGDHAELPPDVAAVVVASHGRDDEVAALTRAVRAGVPYVGLVASRVRGAAVVDALDVCGSMKARITTPAGLDIGARTPEEIALSILADVVARRPRPTGRSITELCGSGCLRAFAAVPSAHRRVGATTTPPT